MTSLLPWSAVTMQARPRRAPRRRPGARQASTASIAATAAGIIAGVADHVRVGEVDDHERSRRPTRPANASAACGAHLRALWS